MFKPMLAPNEKIELDDIAYPLYASIKMDGIRCIFKNGEILSRSLKQIQNKQLRAKFEPLRKITEAGNLILDGEIYSSELTFQQITHFVMTQDLEGEEIPSSLKFHCFDLISNENYNEIFEGRIRNLELLHVIGTHDIALRVEQHVVNNKEEVVSMFEKALAMGQEGLILREPNARYKCGRGTIKEGLIFKVKPWETFDAKIIDIIQATEVNKGIEKKRNELNRSVTSKKKDERHLIEKASAFLVNYQEQLLKVTIAMSDVEKEDIWKNKDLYIGKIVEYKAMTVGMKDMPRHPIFLRFRKDKDA